MKETKDELRLRINELLCENRKLTLELAENNIKHKQELQKLREDLYNFYKDQAYQKFLENNEEYLNRFITDFLTEKLKINVNCNYNYNESVKVELKLNNEIISDSEDNINHSDNPIYYC